MVRSGLRYGSLLRAVALALIGLALLSFLPGSSKAQAHPLGNFTVNRYSRIELSPGTLSLRYVLDMAEIPAFQERPAVDIDRDGTYSTEERSAYLNATADGIRRAVELTINGDSVDLNIDASELSFPAGQGGLNTQRVVVDYSAAMPEGWDETPQEVRYNDANYQDRLGWSEVVVRPLDGIRISDSTAPAQGQTDELRSYPEDSLAKPLDVSEASFEFARGVAGAPSPAAVTTVVAKNVTASSNDAFTSLIATEEVTVRFILAALAIAMGFGALHAFAPGHGKTIVAAYLVGERGTARHALFLGLAVTATHTSSVFALGLATLYASQFIVPERLYPWLTLLSGLLVLGLGAILLASRSRNAWRKHRDGVRELNRRTSHRDTQEPERAGHDHSLPGAHGSPITWKSLVALGVSGGIVPCPSALVVLLGAISLHRLGLGLLLVVAFSVGLAAVLTGIGLALVWAGRLVSGARGRFAASWFERPGLVPRLSQALPAVSALAITGVGVVMTMRALQGTALLGL